MALSMNLAFNHSDIGGIAQIKEDKIWLLKGKADDALVIKMESRVTGGDIKAASPVLRAIDPLARMKPLKQGEMEAMVLFCAGLFNTGPIAHPTFTREKLHKLISELRSKQPFAKMPRQTVMDLDSALKKRVEGIEDPMRSLTQALLDKGGLEKLGEIIAGDLFNANNDRFDFRTGQGGVTYTMGNLKVQTRCIANVGNILLTSQGGQFKPSMLDYVDPYTDTKDLNFSLIDSEKRRIWSGRKLLTRDARKVIAETVIADLEDLIYAPPHKCSRDKKLGKDAPRRIQTGLDMAIINILLELELKGAGKGTSKLPKLVIDRYDLLCTWKK